MGCTGPCKQGRLPCPAPDACQRENDEAMDMLGKLAVGVLSFILISIGAIAVLAWVSA